MEELKAATDAVIAQFKEKWEAEDAKLQRLLKNRDRLPNNYWVEEHRARALYITAMQLRELLG